MFWWCLALFFRLVDSVKLNLNQIVKLLNELKPYENFSVDFITEKVINSLI
jgi:hypothetical protein